MKAKKGISLIVLVITIIVIIILAGAVILSLNKNNPISDATKARYLSNKDSVQSEVTIALSSAMSSKGQSCSIVADASGTALTDYLKIPTTGSLNVKYTDGTLGTISIGDVPSDCTYQVNEDGRVRAIVNGYDVSDTNFTTDTKTPGTINVAG